MRPFTAALVFLALVSLAGCSRDTGAAEFGTARPASGPLPRIEGLPPVAIGTVVSLDHADERRLGGLVVQAAKDLARALRVP